METKIAAWVEPSAVENAMAYVYEISDEQKQLLVIDALIAQLNSRKDEIVHNLSNSSSEVD